jgi:uncharacterized membrane protein (UPF0127 family)
MKIINQTKNSVLAQDVEIADTLAKRMKGLLGRRDFKTGQALVIKPCNSIHMFFMKFPIDALFVGKNNRVVGAISDIKPFQISPIYFNARFVIELPAGTIQSSATQQGDILSLE